MVALCVPFFVCAVVVAQQLRRTAHGADAVGIEGDGGADPDLLDVDLDLAALRDLRGGLAQASIEAGEGLGLGMADVDRHGDVGHRHRSL